MDRPEQPDRTEPPSIFTKPDPADEPIPAIASPSPEATPDPLDVSAWPPATSDQHDAHPPRPNGAAGPTSDGGRPSRRTVIGLAAMGGAIILLLSFIAVSILGSDNPPPVAAGDASPTPRASRSAEPTPETTPQATATPKPTPEPTPAGPPVELAVGDWATVTVDELEVRTAAGDDQASRYSLIRGAVVTVAEGPVAADSGTWYRVASLGGAAGWVSSGWIANPYLETILNDPVLIRCGEVAKPVFDMVDGAPVPREVLRVGDFAVPSNKLDVATLATIEIARGVGAEVCVTAQVASDGLPFLRSEPRASACGHAVAEGQAFWLRPAADQEADVSSQIKDPALVHPILVSGPADNRQSSNMRALLTMMSYEGAAGCVSANINVGSDGVESYRGANIEQCSIVTEYNDQNLRLRPAAGGSETWIKLPNDGSSKDEMPLNKSIEVYVATDVRPDGVSSYAHSPYNYERKECA